MKNSFTRAWVGLASASLLLSGLLALVITGAKMPGIKSLVADLDLIRWCLVVHVNLATLVWFTALPAGLIHLALGESRPRPLARLGFGFSLVGILLMLSVPPGSGTEIVMANYIPVLAHPRYYLALGLYIAGVAMNFVSPGLLRARVSREWPGLNEVRFGLIIGVAFFLLAALTLGRAHLDLASYKLVDSKSYFEIGMWGGGHLLQHASVAFLLCGWVMLLSKESGRPLLERGELFPAFAALGIPIFIVPLILGHAVTSAEYRESFTLLMRWGIAPASLVLMALLIRRFTFSRASAGRFAVVAFALSAVLLTLGFVFGALIRGPDMRVPGHYHAGIGAVTLTFMALAFQVLAKQDMSRWMLRAVWTYGIGQTLFASGMFIAGSFGMGRKTYGAEHALTHWGQYLGFAMMAVGGLAAFAGGLLFARAIFPHLLPSTESRDRFDVAA